MQFYIASFELNQEKITIHYFYRRKMRNSSQLSADLPPGDAIYQDTSLYAKQPTQMGFQNRQLATGGAACREMRHNDYSYVKEMWPAGTPSGRHDHTVEPVYQVQNVRSTPLGPPIQCTSQGGALSNPYGIESFGPSVNPYGSRVPLPSKGKKSNMTDTTDLESDEGQHIYESPDGDYNTMSTRYFELDNNAQKQSTPKSGNIRTQRI